MLMHFIASWSIEDFFPGLSRKALCCRGSFKRIDQFTDCEYPCCLLVRNVCTEAGFRQSDKLDPAQRIESEIQFHIHCGIKRGSSRFRLMDKLSEHGSRSLFKTRLVLFRSPLLSNIRFSAIEFRFFNFKALQFARDCSRQRFTTD